MLFTEHNRTGLWPEHGIHTAQQGGFTGSVGTENRDDLIRPGFAADILENRMAVVSEREILNA
jgi:hypothetical protein